MKGAKIEGFFEMLSPSCLVKGYVSYLLLCAVCKSVVQTGKKWVLVVCV